MAESQAESTFTKFLRATNETRPVALSDELLKTISMKSIKLKKFEIAHLDQGTSWSSNYSVCSHFASFCSEVSFDFSVFHCFPHAQMIRNIAHKELIYGFF